MGLWNDYGVICIKIQYITLKVVKVMLLSALIYITLKVVKKMTDFMSLILILRRFTEMSLK